MKINLSEYAVAGKIATKAVAKANATMFTTATSGRLPKDIDFVRNGRRSWIEWWKARLEQQA